MSDEQFVPEGEAVGEGVEAPLTPASADLEQETTDEVSVEETPATEAAPAAEDAVDYEQLYNERTEDLQRVTAEYVNYKRRVDRDRGVAKQQGIEKVVNDLLPVLDAIALAKQHDDLAEGSKMIVDELEKVTSKHGLVQFGAVGEAFDPVKHEALMQMPLDEPVEVATVSQVIQPGYELGGRVIRPARVAVANP